MAGKLIAAVATPLAPGGIGIVRLSGDGAVEAAGRMFRPRGALPLAKREANTVTLGQVTAQGRPVDECLAILFRAPRSYTGEDVVEFQCHGGVTVLRLVLEEAFRQGARPAEPGEFTRRAFLNGRLDLTEAEAVMELIGAKGEQAAAAALSRHEGALSRRVEEIRRGLFDISADICAFVDFPDEDIPDLAPPVLEQKLRQLLQSVEECIATAGKGRLLRDGVETVIAGRPNVGKSTLMNRLAGRQRSIVTPIPGTTRDVVEESVTFAGCVLNLADTAGLRSTDDPVESLGVGLARERLRQAQLIFAVFDASAPLEPQDMELLAELRHRPAVALLNKADLGLKIDKEYIQGACKQIVDISAQTGEGLDELERVTAGILQTGALDPGEGILANERQLACALQAKEGLEAALAAQLGGMTLDAVSTGVEQAVAALETLTGERATEELLDRVFEKFCVGK